MFKNFDELVFDLPRVLYKRCEQVIPFIDERSTGAGRAAVRVGHILKALSDERFIQRQKEFTAQDKNKSLSQKTAPTELMWSDLCTDRIGYKPREDWRQKVKGVDKVDVVTTLVQITPIDEVEEWPDLIDEDALTCHKFRVFFGGVPLESWQEWFTSGHLPENIVFFNDADYAAKVALVEKGISPSLLLEVAHYFNEGTAGQMDEFMSVFYSQPDKSKLASAIKSELTDVERMGNLYDKIASSSEGYDNDIPIWHKGAAVTTYFLGQMARMGKSRI